MKVKRIYIDFEDLDKYDLSLEEYIALANFYVKNIRPSNDYIESLIDKGHVIKITDNKFVLSSTMRNYLHSIIVPEEETKDKEKKQTDKELKTLISERIEEYRDKWKGRKVGAMGSPGACKQNMLTWMKENPEYSFDDILKAADIYLNTEGRNPRFLQRADYFIYKNDANKVKHSRLSAYVEELDNFDEHGDDDWTTEIN